MHKIWTAKYFWCFPSCAWCGYILRESTAPGVGVGVGGGVGFQYKNFIFAVSLKKLRNYVLYSN